MERSPLSSEGSPVSQTTAGDVNEPDETESLLPKTLVDPSDISMSSLHDSQASDAKHTILGMICVAVGTGFICTVGALVQNHGGSVLELMQGRYLVQNFISIVWWKFRKPEGTQSWYGDPPHRANIWVRGLLYWILIFCWWRGLEMIELGDAEAILFLSPVITVILGRIWLKEPFPKVFPITIILVISGVLFVCQPPFVFGGGTKPVSILGLIFLVGCCLAWSVACILVRTAREAHWLQLEIVSSGQAFWIWTPLLILLNRTWWKSSSLSGGQWDFGWNTFVIVGIAGILGFVGLCLNVVGYQIGDATKVAWMEYLDLVFAFVYQWGVFGQAPNMYEIIGVCLLLGTCVVHLLEELHRWFFKETDKKRDSQEITNKQYSDIQKTETQIDVSKTHNTLGDKTSTETDPLLLTSKPRVEPVNKLSMREKLNQMFERMTIFSIDSTE